ncbi:MAG: MotA/TolQ/ExbB proton channel family protein [Pseudobacteriovorax sp.]|nr:MotA/TolQ/ExbB proton channel family protein [Pseudobacteriovorax sp.]
MLRAVIGFILLSATQIGLAQQANIPDTAEPKTQKVDSLDVAYQKELIFLRQELKVLKERRANIESRLNSDISSLKGDVSRLQSKQLTLQKSSETTERELRDITSDTEQFVEQRDAIEQTLQRVNETLEQLGFVPSSEELTFIPSLQQSFNLVLQALDENSRVREIANTEFFDQNGQKVSGTITKIGQIASFGHVDGQKLGLAPAGNGQLKVWLNKSSQPLILEDNAGSSTGIFLYNSLANAVAAAKDKTLSDVLESGGTIGWVITILGLVALLGIVIRAIILRRNQSQHKAVETQMAGVLENLSETSINSIENLGGGSARLSALALRNKDSEKFEDIIAEGYIEESQKLDRFGTFILVVSAVAPLLGLLGTVTGMIATFDIITEFGTGDPKLLSGGISEALVTTMFGLIVAIPALLLGNLLSSWAESLKADMEKLVLKIHNSGSAPSQ